MTTEFDNTPKTVVVEKEYVIVRSVDGDKKNELVFSAASAIRFAAALVAAAQIVDGSDFSIEVF